MSGNGNNGGALFKPSGVGNDEPRRKAEESNGHSHASANTHGFSNTSHGNSSRGGHEPDRLSTSPGSTDRNAQIADNIAERPLSTTGAGENALNSSKDSVEGFQLANDDNAHGNSSGSVDESNPDNVIISDSESSKSNWEINELEGLNLLSPVEHA
ncbi:unnamed protein product [Ceutorhynchus assimilis]|uniref:Uncharacterized protein n=1 Tax=Ceutorhynchus assimilis TaxID=467358 RepID=A0A9N9MZQ7_9CUCU|nr:unnamed protein product [Ceutorhynchus assimilis]